jgi:cysteine-rich repeat protein
MEGNEQCDDGNTLDGDCCSSTCQFESRTTVCRPATGFCDVAETCTGTSAICPADTGTPDSDNDEQCDAEDLCTNGTLIDNGKLKLSDFTTGAGDDTLSFSGSLVFAMAPVLDPVTNGVSMLLEDADGTLFDVTLPGGVFDFGTKTGWKINASGTAWTFSSPTAVDDAVNKVVLKQQGNQITFTISGKKGAFAVPPLTLPLQATLVLDPPLAMIGQCGEASLTVAQCAFNKTQTTLTCK